MHIKQYILIITSLLFLACQKDMTFLGSETNADNNDKVTVGFWVGNGSSSTTRTSIDDNGQSVSWSNGDKVALWATNGSSYTFQHQTFNLWFRTADNSRAYFTTELGSAMAEGTYTYYACYPIPSSVSGTTATFTVPSTQDGKMGGGADIMVAQGTGPALDKLYAPDVTEPDYVIDQNGLHLTMRHLIHALRFYVPQAKWGFPDGETVERIVFTMPTYAAGTATADVASETGALALASGGNQTISLNLTEPITSTAADATSGVVAYDYACASILPATYNGTMTVKAYSQTKASQVAINIPSRTMAAGHVTPVSLDCSNVIDQYVLRFKFGDNNLGEDVIAVRVQYSDENGTAQTLTIPVEHFSKKGDVYDVDLSDWDTDFSALRSTLKSQTITIEYESANAIVYESVVLPDMTQIGIHNVTLNVPYLFFENFSATTSSTSYNDNNGTGVTNSGKTSAANLTGSYSWPSYRWTDSNNNIGIWSGARCGLSAGESARICARSENAVGFPAAYYGRLDSPNMGCLKSGASVKLRIQFNYSVNRAGSRTSSHQHYIAVGTHSTQGLIDAESGVGSWVSSGLTGITINANVASGLTGSHTGSFSSVTTPVDKTVSNCTSSTRFVWEVYIDKKSDDGYYNNWAYIDDVKISIVSE